MSPKQTIFLKSCFRLPGLSSEISLSAKKFLDSEAFFFFVLKQLEQLSLPGLRFSPKKYLQTGKWGFAASIDMCGQEKLLLLALQEEDSFMDAMVKLIAAVNALMAEVRQPLAQEQHSFFQKLIGFFTYQPAPLTLHLIDAGSDCYIGYLPETVSTVVRISDIAGRDLISQMPFVFPVFSYQPKEEKPMALVVNAWDSADPELLSDFTNLCISNKGGWHVTRGDEKINLNCTDHYKDVIGAINRLTKKTGARLYLQPYPWSKELLFFISEREEESYVDFLFHPGDEKKHRSSDKQEKLELTEAYIDANPADTAALGELTTCYGNLKKHQKVLDLIAQYLLLAPNSYVLRNNKLIALVHLQRYKEAVEAGKETLKIREHSSRTHYFLGVAYTQLGQYEDAFFCLKFCTSKSPEEPFGWFALGFAYYKTGDYDTAIENYKQCIKTVERYGTKKSARASSWYNMACIYSVQNKIEESKHAFTEALRMDPNYKNDLFEDEELENLKNAVNAEELYKAAGI